MKEYTLLERLIMVLKVVLSIVSWVSRIIFKMVRDMLPGGKGTATAASPTRSTTSNPSTNS